MLDLTRPTECRQLVGLLQELDRHNGQFDLVIVLVPCRR
jgi:hypothetical protein